MGSSSFTLSSIGTGGIFSPPAVIINSETKKVEETMSIQLLIMGSSSSTLCSISTEGIFSPPAVIINSETKKVGETEHTDTDNG